MPDPRIPKLKAWFDKMISHPSAPAELKLGIKPFLWKIHSELDKVSPEGLDSIRDFVGELEDILYGEEGVV